MANIPDNFKQIHLLGQVKVADEFIHIRPCYAIGGTFLAGLFLGWFMSRK